MERKNNMPWKQGELVIIEGGEAHIVGYWEDNENEDGPQPMRYVDVVGCVMPYGEMVKAIKEKYGSMCELESMFKWCVYVGMTDEEAREAYAMDMSSYKEITQEDFLKGDLPDGNYFVASE